MNFKIRRLATEDTENTEENFTGVFSVTSVFSVADRF